MEQIIPFFLVKLPHIIIITNGIYEKSRDEFFLFLQ